MAVTRVGEGRCTGGGLVWVVWETFLGGTLGCEPMERRSVYWWVKGRSVF